MVRSDGYDLGNSLLCWSVVGRRSLAKGLMEVVFLHQP